MASRPGACKCCAGRRSPSISAGCTPWRCRGRTRPGGWAKKPARRLLKNPLTQISAPLLILKKISKHPNHSSTQRKTTPKTRTWIPRRSRKPLRSGGQRHAIVLSTQGRFANVTITTGPYLRPAQQGERTAWGEGQRSALGRIWSSPVRDRKPKKVAGSRAML